MDAEVHLEDYFEVISVVGQLINKAEPDEDDERPYQQFCKAGETCEVQEEEGGEVLEYQYVPVSKMPEILHNIFLS